MAISGALMAACGITGENAENAGSAQDRNVSLGWREHPGSCTREGDSLELVPHQRLQWVEDGVDVQKSEEPVVQSGLRDDIAYSESEQGHDNGGETNCDSESSWQGHRRS